MAQVCGLATLLMEHMLFLGCKSSESAAERPGMEQTVCVSWWQMTMILFATPLQLI